MKRRIYLPGNITPPLHAEYDPDWMGGAGGAKPILILPLQNQGKIRDRSGYQHIAEAGEAFQTNLGPWGTVGKFNATEAASIVLSDSPQWFPRTNFTVEYMAKGNTNNGNCYICGRMQETTNAWAIRHEQFEMKLRFYFSADGGDGDSRYFDTFAGAWTQNVWCHYVVSVAEVGTNTVVTSYANGQITPNGAQTLTATNLYATLSQLRIGHLHTWDRLMDGDIAFINVYPWVVTAVQAAEMANKPYGGYYIEDAARMFAIPVGTPPDTPYIDDEDEDSE